VPAWRLAVGREAAVGVGLGIDLQGGRFVGVEGTAQHSVFVGSKVVMFQDGQDRELGFEGGDVHKEKYFTKSFSDKSVVKLKDISEQHKTPRA